MEEQGKRLAKMLGTVNLSGLAGGISGFYLDGIVSAVIVFSFCFLGSLILLYIAEEKKNS